MFGDLKTIGIASAVAFVIGGLATAATYERLIVPGRLADERTAVTRFVTESVTQKVTAERDAACLLATTEAERAARTETAERYAKAVNAARVAWQQSAEQSAAQSAAELASLESEIRGYETRLRKLGRLCALSPDDYRFVYGDGVQLPGAQDDGQ